MPSLAIDACARSRAVVPLMGLSVEQISGRRLPFPYWMR